MASGKIKTANKITTDMLLRILLYEPETQLDAFGFSEKMVIDFIKIVRLCSYSTVGEVLELTKKQVGSTTLELTRGNIRKSSKLVVKVNKAPELKRLINRYRQKGNTTYVFPFLNLTAAEKKQLKKNRTKNGIAYQRELSAIQRKKIKLILMRMNRHLRKIAATLNLGVNLSTYSLLIALRYFDRQQQQSSLCTLPVRRYMEDKGEEWKLGV
jgi:hypothetical protein